MRWLLAFLVLGYAGCWAAADTLSTLNRADREKVISDMVWAVHDGDAILIHAAELAKTAGGKQSTRALVGALAEEHALLTEELLDLRRTLRLGESKSSIDINAPQLVALASLKGDDFDKAYLKEARRILSDQRRKIGAYANVAGSGYPLYWTIRAQSILEKEAEWVERWEP